jgi:endogenous inhibitor of DNA gyrase (YacG/DUF329 family)
MELPLTPEPRPQSVLTLSSETLVVCPGCGKPFESRRTNQRFCSAKCRLVGYHKKQERERRDRDATIRLHLRGGARLR